MPRQPGIHPFIRKVELERAYGVPLAARRTCSYMSDTSFPRKILATKVPPSRNTCVVMFNAYRYQRRFHKTVITRSHSRGVGSAIPRESTVPARTHRRRASQSLRACVCVWCHVVESVLESNPVKGFGSRACSTDHQVRHRTRQCPRACPQSVR